MEQEQDKMPAVGSGDIASQLINKYQLATQFRVTTRTINLMIARGELPKPVKLGRRPAWFRDKLEAWMRAKQQDVPNRYK